MKNLRLLLINLFLWLPSLVFAVDGDDKISGRMKNIATGGGYATSDAKTPIQYAGLIVQMFLSILGIIFVILVIRAGFNWMMAGGETGKIDKAKEALWRAVIGLLIILGAAAIQSYVFNKI